MIDADVFRAGMRRLAASVCIIASRTLEGERFGLTATAVCSVSADPPTLLVCINRSSATHDVIRAAGIFSVNVLAHEDRAVADRFASRLGPAEKFAEGRWQPGSTGAPRLESAIASFDCSVAEAIDVGTHGIFFGAIQSAAVRPGGEPLLFASGRFGGFATQQDVFDPSLFQMPSWS